MRARGGTGTPPSARPARALEELADEVDLGGAVIPKGGDLERGILFGIRTRMLLFSRVDSPLALPETEVYELDVASARDEEVCGLDVTMEHARHLQLIEGGNGVREDLRRGLRALAGQNLSRGTPSINSIWM